MRIVRWEFESGTTLTFDIAVSGRRYFQSRGPTKQRSVVPYSLGQMVAYFLRLGSLGFGGPVALVGYMHRDLVEQRQWISEADYREGLTLSQLMPGPLAAQLAIYLGYVHYRVFGATLTAVAFVDGVTAAAIGAIAGAVVVLGRRTILGAGWTPDWAKVVLAAVTLLLLYRWKKLPEPIIVLGAALVGLAVYPFVRAG